VLVKTSAQIRKEAEEAAKAKAAAAAAAQARLQAAAKAQAELEAQTAAQAKAKAEAEATAKSTAEATAAAKAEAERQAKKAQVQKELEDQRKRYQEARQRAAELRRAQEDARIKEARELQDKLARELLARQEQETKEQLNVIAADAKKALTETQDYQSRTEQYRAQILERRKKDTEKALVQKAVDDEKGQEVIAEIKQGNDQRDQTLVNDPEEVSAYDDAEKAAELTKEKQTVVENWLRMTMPTAAQTRAAAQSVYDKLKASLAGVTGAEERQAIENQLAEIKLELDSVKETESDLFSTLDEFSRMGGQVLEWITEYMTTFFQKLRDRMNKLWNMFYLVFVQIIPPLVTGLTKAVMEPFYLLAGKTWSGLKYAGTKVTEALGSGMSSAIKWLKAKGGELSEAAYKGIGKLYSGARTAAGAVTSGSKSLIKGLWYYGSQTLHLVSKAGGKIGGVLVTLVGGVWKIIKNPLQQLVVAGITKYFQALWNDPKYAKLILEVIRYGRDNVCEIVSNWAYDPRYKDVTAFEQAKESGGSFIGKSLEYVQWITANASMEWMSSPDGLGKGIKSTLGAGLKGIKNVVSFQKLLGGTAAIAGAAGAVATVGVGTAPAAGLAMAGSAAGAMIDSAVDYVFTESTEAIADAATAAAVVKIKRDTLTEHFNFWINFFTDDCIYPRIYNVNTTGWGESTLNLLSFGFYGESPETIPLTSAHIELEKQQVELRKRLQEDEGKVRTLKQQDPVAATQLQADIDRQRRVIANNDEQIDVFVAEALENKRLRESGYSPKGLWAALNLPAGQVQAVQKVKELGAGIGSWIFNLSDLWSQSKIADIQDDNLKKYLAGYKQLVDAKLSELKVANTETVTSKRAVETAMKKLIELQSQTNVTFNPITWVRPLTRDLSPVEKQAEEIQKLTQVYEANMAKVDRLSSEYLQLNNRLLDKGKYSQNVSVKDEELKELAKLGIQAPAPPATLDDLSKSSPGLVQ